MDRKKLFRKLIFLPAWAMLLLVAVSAALLILVFSATLEESVVAYISYGLSFYTLCVVGVFCAVRLPKQIANMKEKVYATRLGNRYMTDPAFRTQISLYISLGVSLLYGVVNLLSWFWIRSWWFVVLAGYYGIMAGMRFLLLRGKTPGKNIRSEWRRSRICAYILLLINLSLSGAVLMILYQDRGYAYPGIMIYVMALYTFYATIHAIVEIVKYRALGSPVMTTAKVVSLSAALVSLLNLETAMFAEFGGDMARKDQNLMIILTGAGISVIVVSMSVLLIVKATKEVRRKSHGKK